MELQEFAFSADVPAPQSSTLARPPRLPHLRALAARHDDRALGELVLAEPGCLDALASDDYAVAAALIREASRRLIAHDGALAPLAEAAIQRIHVPERIANHSPLVAYVQALIEWHEARLWSGAPPEPTWRDLGRLLARDLSAVPSLRERVLGTCAEAGLDRALPADIESALLAHADKPYLFGDPREFLHVLAFQAVRAARSGAAGGLTRDWLIDWCRYLGRLRFGRAHGDRRRYLLRELRDAVHRRIREAFRPFDLLRGDGGGAALALIAVLIRVDYRLFVATGWSSRYFNTIWFLPLRRALRWLANRAARRARSTPSATGHAPAAGLDMVTTGALHGGTSDVLVTRAQGGIGDILMMRASLLELARRRRPGRVYFATNPDFFGVFSRADPLTLVDIERVAIARASFGDWVNLTECPATRAELAELPAIRTSRIESFARALGVAVPRFTGERRDLAAAGDAGRARALELLSGFERRDRPAIGIQLRAADGYRDAPALLDVARSLASRFNVVVFDNRPIPRRPDDAFLAVGSEPLPVILSLIARLHALVTPDSFALHVAGVCGIPCVGLFGPTDGEVRTRHYPTVRFVDARASLPCVPCWRHEFSKCRTSDSFESVCMTAIPAAAVVAALEDVLGDPGTPPPGTWRFPDRTALQDEQIARALARLRMLAAQREDTRVYAALRITDLVQHLGASDYAIGASALRYAGRQLAEGVDEPGFLTFEILERLNMPERLPDDPAFVAYLDAGIVALEHLTHTIHRDRAWAAIGRLADHDFEDVPAARGRMLGFAAEAGVRIELPAPVHAAILKHGDRPDLFADPRDYLNLVAYDLSRAVATTPVDAAAARARLLDWCRFLAAAGYPRPRANSYRPTLRQLKDDIHGRLAGRLSILGTLCARSGGLRAALALLIIGIDHRVFGATGLSRRRVSHVWWFSLLRAMLGELGKRRAGAPAGRPAAAPRDDRPAPVTTPEASVATAAAGVLPAAPNPLAERIRKLFQDSDALAAPPETGAAMTEVCRVPLVHAVGDRITPLTVLFPEGIDPDDATLYRWWLSEHDAVTDADRARIGVLIRRMVTHPRLSFVVPATHMDDRLVATVRSLATQLYPEIEILVLPTRDPAPDLSPMLERIAGQTGRLRLIRAHERATRAELFNLALHACTGAFVGLIDEADLLSETAAFAFARALAGAPATRLAYCDEDAVDPVDGRRLPMLKPDWDPDAMLAQNQVGRLALFRTDVTRALGGMKAEFAEDAEHDLILRIAHGAAARDIRHLPSVLYHRRREHEAGSRERDARWTSRLRPGARAASAVTASLAASATAGSCAADGTGRPLRVVYPIADPRPSVSIVIPTRDRAGLLRRCLDGVLRGTAYAPIEVVIVDNDSREAETHAYLAELAHDPRVRVLRHPGAFNWAAMNNRAIDVASGDVIVLLNNDIEIIEPQWLDELVAQALRPEVGVVGAKLLYPDRRVQHAGLATGWAGPAVHLWRFAPEHDPGYLNHLSIVRGVAAVTGACLALRRAVFAEVGGLEATHLPVTCSDTDLCFRVRARGYRVIWTPFARLIHAELMTRGADETPEKNARSRREEAHLRRTWGAWLDADPHLSPHLLRGDHPVRIATRSRVPRPWDTDGSGS